MASDEALRDRAKRLGLRVEKAHPLQHRKVQHPAYRIVEDDRVVTPDSNHGYALTSAEVVEWLDEYASMIESQRKPFT